MREACRYNTTVSLHINMNDAYENSPLWHDYEEMGVITGKGGIWDGEQSYLISHVSAFLVSHAGLIVYTRDSC